MTSSGFGISSNGDGAVRRDYALQLTVAAGISIVAGWGTTVASDKFLTLLLAAVFVGVVLIRWPVLSVVAVVILGSLFGRVGAHWLVPGVGLPVFEIMLALGGGASILLLATRYADGRTVNTGPFIIWIPAAIWGFALIAFFNQGSFISGLRDSLLFIYPLLVALPLATLPASSLRRGLARWAPGFVILAFGVLAIGTYNMLSGSDLSQTSTGQVRALAGSFSPALAAGFLAALWMFQTGRWSAVGALLGSASLVGLLLVNHRSAYLALIACLLVLGLMRLSAPRQFLRGLAPVLAPLALAVVVVLAATPVGRAGVDRFASIDQRSDENISFRLQSTREATEQTGSARLFGSGVGLEGTDLGVALTDPAQQYTHRGVHNSYAAAFMIGGVIGLTSIVAPLLWVLTQMFRRRQDLLMQFLLPLTVFTMVMGALNVVLENVYFSVWLWWPLIAASIVCWGDPVRQPSPTRGEAHDGDAQLAYLSTAGR